MGKKAQETVEQVADSAPKRRAPRTKDEVAVLLKVPELTLHTVKLTIEGLSPLVMNRFGEKARQEMHDKHARGDAGKSRSARAAKDFKAQFEAAKHKSSDGWYGIPCGSLVAAMISACRAGGIVMSRAKLALWVEPDGYEDDGTALTRITKGLPVYDERPVRNASGVPDLRARPMFKPGWRATVTIMFDPGMIDVDSIGNLLNRAGRQVGILEGRRDSKKSAGMGWGSFRILGSKEE